MLELKFDLAKLPGEPLYNLTLRDPNNAASNSFSLPIYIPRSPNAGLPESRSVIFKAAHDHDNARKLYFEPASRLRCHTADKDFDAAIAIYRGILVSSQDNIRIAVVCKIAYDAKRLYELRHEAEFYITHLVSCQGEQVPYFYGLFKHADENIACMFLQDVGDPSERIVSVCKTSPPVRRLLLERVIALHGQHVRHNQLYRQLHHIVWSDDPLTHPRKAKPFLVDFKQSKADHRCGFHEIGQNTDDLYLEEWEPYFDDILCEEIFEICSFHLRLWIPAHWQCRDASTPLSIYLKDTETFLTHLVSPNSSQQTIDRAKKFADSEVKRFRAVYGQWLEKYENDWPTEGYNDGRFKCTRHTEMK